MFDSTLNIGIFSGVVVVSMIQIMSAPFDRRSDIKIATYQAIEDSYEK